jgi:hypothetical protein
MTKYYELFENNLGNIYQLKIFESLHLISVRVTMADPTQLTVVGGGYVCR